MGVTDAVGGALEKTKSMKGIILSQPRGNHHMFSHCEVCKMTETTRARMGVDGVACKFGGFSSQQIQSRCGHKNALIVQNHFTNSIQSERNIGVKAACDMIPVSLTETQT